MKKGNQIKQITLVLKPRGHNEFRNLIPVLCSWLLRRKKKIQFLSRDIDRIQKILKGKRGLEYTFISEEDVFAKSDLIVSLGGDGTLIGLSRVRKNSSTPVFGINLGHLGFIAEFTKVDMYDQLTKFFENKLKCKKVHLHSATVFKKGKSTGKNYFMNDAVINKLDISRMFTLRVEADDDHIFNLAGDGVIISTPLGSTAYSMAAGGPIVHPDVKAMVLTPICPHALTNRPVVLSDQTKLRIKANDNDEEGVTVTLDGQLAMSVEPGDVIQIQRETRKAINFVMNSDRSYFDTLKNKFFYGRRDT